MTTKPDMARLDDAALDQAIADAEAEVARLDAWLKSAGGGMHRPQAVFLPTASPNYDPRPRLDYLRLSARLNDAHIWLADLLRERAERAYARLNDVAAMAALEADWRAALAEVETQTARLREAQGAARAARERMDNRRERITTAAEDAARQRRIGEQWRKEQAGESAEQAALETFQAMRAGGLAAIGR